MQIQATGISGYGASRRGANHSRNEDRYLIEILQDTMLKLAVSDGLGGHAAGDIAAELTIASISDLHEHPEGWSTALVSSIRDADEKLQQRGEREKHLEGMAATITVAILSQSYLWWANLGDSRLYLFRDHTLKQVSKDHSFVQDFIDAGELTREEAAYHPLSHVLDQCVGCRNSDVDTGELPLSTGDVILLCTDGVYREVSEAMMLSILPLTYTESPEACIQALLATCRESQAPDDCTAVVAVVR